MRAAAVVIAGVVALAGVAHAGPSVRLAVHGDACSAELVRARVVAVRGEDPFDDAADAMISVALARGDDGVAADVDSDRGSRHLAAPTCEALADELAIAIGVELEDLARPPAPIAAPAAQPVANGISARVDAPSRAAMLLVAASSFSVTGDHVRTQVAVGARWRRGAGSLGVQARLVLPETLVVAPGATADVTTATAAADLCAHARSVSACAVVSLGGVHGGSSGLYEAQSAWSPLAALGARTAWVRPVGARVALEAAVEVDAPVTTTRFLVDAMPVWTTPRVEVWAGIGVVSRFP